MNQRNKKFFLFRVKFIRFHQQEIFDDGASSAVIFAEAIREKPLVKLRRGAEWKLANLNDIGRDGGTFVVGRISEANTEKFDFSTDDFVEARDYQGPFSTVFFNRKTGVVGIEEKSKVNSKVSATAKRLYDLLESTRAVRTRNVKCVVDPIIDPEDFIQKIRKSSHVLKFRATFTGPNPSDADAIFQKPLEIYAKEINADKGVIEVIGANLDKDVVIDITRSNAATGNFVNARIETKGVVETIPLRGINANFTARGNETPTEIFNKMLATYEQVRHESD